MSAKAENGVSLADLVTKVNSALGNFCSDFANRRKELAKLGRTPARDRLFTYDKNSKRDWAINRGGGTEIQFHLFVRDNSCGYGLGFNAQYVPYKNDRTPQEYMFPFAKAYLELKDSEVVKRLKDSGFSFKYGKEDELIKFTDDYYLFGKVIALGIDNELSQADFDQMISDIKGDLFELYCMIFELRNKGEEKMSNEQKLLDLLRVSHNLILTGAPGTGKSFLAMQLADALTEDSREPPPSKRHSAFVQFHPSYDYTDFVEGLRPISSDKDGNIGFERKDGIFKEFCKNAISFPNQNYVFIIDEINRGDIAKIFGELFFAIDPGYRNDENRIPIKTQYQNLIQDQNDPFKDGFYIPDNVYIIGTMNDIDRNVESMDFAVRRRFTWKQIAPEDTQDAILKDLGAVTVEEAKERMNRLNKAIRKEPQLGGNFCIGAAYFKNIDDTPEKWDNLWNYHLAPLLAEYVRGLPDAGNMMVNFKAEYNKEKQTDANISAQR